MNALARVRELAAGDSALALLVLYGSRARGEARPDSDWDFGYLADAAFDPGAFLGALVGVTGCDRVDLVDLDRMGGQLRYRAAADGVVVVERQGAFDGFWRAAVSYWLDMQDVIRAEYDRALARLTAVSRIDGALIAERALAVERHLARVAQRLPPSAYALAPSTDASDAVILHLWQATQIVIDVATAACLRLALGTPTTYADAFERLGTAGVIDAAQASRLVRAAGFRNVVAHACERLDMRRVHEAARTGPPDLRALLASVRDRF
jgi:uncharacterized protein YutE (UPF0331/DUF86 family)